MKKAYVFPGQGSQFPGMGKDLYDQSIFAKDQFELANSIIGFRISDIMFSGTEEELKQTNVTQPAIFIHSVILAQLQSDFQPHMVAGHSLGEFSALVAAKALSFEDGLKLVSQRADAMQEACMLAPSTMAAVLGLEDDIVVEICASINDIVVPANFNCPGQLVISGSITGIEKAMVALKEAGAKRVLPLVVGGAFHSPLMDSAKAKLAKAIEQTHFSTPICPIFQNVDANPYSSVNSIKINLINQLTAPVRWTQSIQNMVKYGANEFIECGPGKVLQGLIKKIEPGVSTSSVVLI